MIFTKCCDTSGTWDPTFTAKGSPLIVLIPLIVVLALYIWMTLRTGGAWLIPTLRIVSRKENPAGYWAAITAAALALTIAFAATAYAAPTAVCISGLI